MDVSKFEWLLNNERLFMPTADKLGDPLEGSTPRGEIAWWQREAEKAETEEALGVIAHNRAFFSHFAQFFRNLYHVSCWHMNPHENYSMWRCYTTQTESVAIRTTYCALREALPIRVLLGVIRYIDYSMERLPYGNMFEYIMHKDAYYKYETEVRAVITLPPNKELGLEEFEVDFFSLSNDDTFRIYAPRIDVGKLIQGIVLHPEAPEPFAARVRDLCAAKGLPAPTLSRETTKPQF